MGEFYDIKTTEKGGLDATKKSASPFPDPGIKGLDVSVTEFGWSSDQLGPLVMNVVSKMGMKYYVPMLYEGYVMYVMS